MNTDVEVGFTGVWNDPVTMGYPLGNGYRWYLPGLMRFNAPDGFSPFEAGGINPYVYCGADPVNRTDPSGHFSIPLGFAEDLARSIQTDALAEASALLAPADLDPVLTEIHRPLGKRFRFVAEGYSGLGFDKPALFEARFRADLEPVIGLYGRENVSVIAGATPEGVGKVYEIAKEYGLHTMGIVSDAAKAYPGGISKYVDDVVYVPRPPDNWEVISPHTGYSYMVSAASGDGSKGSLGGAIYAYGGGDVAVTETTEAIDRKVPYHLHPDLDPNPEEVAKRRLRNPNLNPTPMRDLVEELKRKRLLR